MALGADKSTAVNQAVLGFAKGVLEMCAAKSAIGQVPKNHLTTFIRLPDAVDWPTAVISGL